MSSNHQQDSTLPVIAITCGEPAGIGPDIILQMANAMTMDAMLVVLSDKAVLQQRQAQLGLSIDFIDYQPGKVVQAQKNQLIVQHVPVAQTVEAGQLNPANAPYVLKLLEMACDGCLEGRFSAMVTAPVQKSVISDAGIVFSGHTEFLEARTHSKKVVMMLACSQLKVALATTHLPLAEVSAAITKPLLREVLDTLIGAMQKDFAIKKPTILVAGLNPHAGESGHMGREEIDVINPVLAEYQQQANLIGALPADTLFTPPYLKQADAVLAMYHDQGLPVLKCLGFGESINITLGLPIIRTSVDHGTALDLAGTGEARFTSLRCAVETAIEMARKSR